VDTAGFFGLLFGRCHGWIEIRLVPEGPGRVTSRFFPLPDGVADAVEFALGASGQAHVFFGAEPRGCQRSDADAVVEAGCLFVDLDAGDFGGGAEEIDRRLAAFSPPPTLVTASGGGRHAYWVLAQPLGLQGSRRARLQEALWAVADGLGVPPARNLAHDPPRLLRVPGTLNIKRRYDRPLPCKVLAACPERLYAPSDFGGLVLAALERHPQRAGRRLAYARFRRDSPWRGRPLAELLGGLVLPEPILAEILRGPRARRDGSVDRSGADFRVVKELLRAGCDADRILAIYERAIIGGKHRERRAEDGLYYLARTIGRARQALAEGQPVAGRAS
jgi:hypothetical protein